MTRLFNDPTELADRAVGGFVAAQIVSVATTAPHVGGVLLAHASYAGDLLLFSQSDGRLGDQGITCRFADDLVALAAVLDEAAAVDAGGLSV